MNDLELALAYARGIEGRMRPSPDAAASEDAMNLLRYAAAITAADDPTPPKKPGWRPKWFWDFIAKIALKYWERQERKQRYARVRAWIEANSAAHFSASSGRTLQPNTKRKISNR